MAPKTLIFILLMLVSTTIIHTCSAQTDKKFPAILTFGDSTLDTGNNDFLETLFKANYKPYGKDFPGQVPTGRFSNGKLVSDILASLLKIKETVPPFLDPNLSNDELGTGVNFASAGSGYDELTTSVSGVIPVKNQTQYFEDYIKRLKGVVGEEKAKNIIEGALVIVSAGSNDLVFNYYSLAGSRRQLSITQYHDFLLQRVQDFLKVINSSIHTILSLSHSIYIYISCRCHLGIWFIGYIWSWKPKNSCCWASSNWVSANPDNCKFQVTKQ